MSESATCHLCSKPAPESTVVCVSCAKLLHLGNVPVMCIACREMQPQAHKNSITWIHKDALREGVWKTIQEHTSMIPSVPLFLTATCQICERLAANVQVQEAASR